MGPGERSGEVPFSSPAPNSPIFAVCNRLLLSGRSAAATVVVEEVELVFVGLGVPAAGWLASATGGIGLAGATGGIWLAGATGGIGLAGATGRFGLAGATGRFGMGAVVAVSPDCGKMVL